MMRKLLKNGFAVLGIALALLIVASAIWCLLKKSGALFQDVLFCVGAVPIVMYSIGMFGTYFKRSDTSILLGRSVSHETPSQSEAQDTAESASRFKSGLNWVLAGAAIMLICYLM